MPGQDLLFDKQDKLALAISAVIGTAGLQGFGPAEVVDLVLGVTAHVLCGGIPAELDQALLDSFQAAIAFARSDAEVPDLARMRVAGNA
jgi:hypothetical protein